MISCHRNLGISLKKKSYVADGPWPVDIERRPIHSSRVPRTRDRSTSIVAPAGTAISENWAKPTAVLPVDVLVSPDEEVAELPGTQAATEIPIANVIATIEYLDRRKCWITIIGIYHGNRSSKEYDSAKRCFFS